MDGCRWYDCTKRNVAVSKNNIIYYIYPYFEAPIFIVDLEMSVYKGAILYHIELCCLYGVHIIIHAVPFQAL